MSTKAQQDAASVSPSANGNLVSALDLVFAETVALFQRLRSVASSMHAHGELGSEECTVLQGLDRDGARTITDIAGDCGIPRSKAQKLVKALEKGDVVELVPNPENKRSKLVELTELGRQAIRAMDQREFDLLSQLPLGADEEQLRTAASALAAVRQALDDEDWRRMLNNGTGG
jgi:DNA-binding MarR family transcriptional regulator